MRPSLCLGTMLAASSLAAAGAPLTVDQLAQAREIAGYASGYANRTSLMLFPRQGGNALANAAFFTMWRAFLARSSIATNFGECVARSREPIATESAGRIPFGVFGVIPSTKVLVFDLMQSVASCGERRPTRVCTGESVRLDLNLIGY